MAKREPVPLSIQLIQLQTVKQVAALQGTEF
jgi:hypothetical protein